MGGWTPFPPMDVVLTWPPPSPNPERRGPEQYIVTGIFGTMALAAVSVRFYTRIFVRRYFGIDDYLMVVAIAAAIAAEVFITLGKARYQWDRHLWDWNLKNTEGSLFLLYLLRVFWGVVTGCVRLSILCLYYRLLARLGGEKRHFWVLHIMTGITITFLLWTVLGGAIPCLPVQAYWQFQKMTLAGQSFSCFNDYRAMQAASVINTVSEVAIAILPAVAVFRFKVDPRQRWSVIALLSLGYLVAIAGTVRSYYLWKAAETFDLTWWASPQWCSAEVEIDLAIACACAAPLRAPVARFIRRIRGLPDMVSSIGGGRRTPHTKDDRSILSTTALSGQHDGDKFEGVPAIAEDDRNAWIRQMSRTIDLEGIAVDGFGYTVSIQGPPAPPRRRLSRFKNTGGQLNTGAPSRKSTVIDKDTRTNIKSEEIELSKPVRSTPNRSVELSQDEIVQVHSEDRTNKWSYTRSSSKQDSNRASELSGGSAQNWTFFDATDTYSTR